MGSWKLFSVSSPRGCWQGQAVARGAAGKGTAGYGAGMHSQWVGQRNLISYKPECEATVRAVGAPSCVATELPAGCPPCQRGKHLSPGPLQHSTEKVKPAQAAEIAAGAGEWLQANNIPCLIMPRIKLKFADALITTRHSAHTASPQPRSSVQTPKEKPC